MIRTKIKGIYYSFAGYSTEEIKSVFGLSKLVKVSISEFMRASNKRVLINTLKGAHK
jgi:hypothetical protein